MMKAFATRTHEAMKDVLLAPTAEGPEIHYYMIRGGTDKTNITVWESGTVGGEYIKTYGHYHVGDLDETYKIISGEGIIILQGEIKDDSVEYFKAIRVKAGDEIYIPSAVGHLGINIGKTWFVTSDDSPVNFGEKDPVGLPGHADYEPMKRLRGVAYYVVEKDGNPTLVKNPLYKNVPEAKIENCSA